MTSSFDWNSRLSQRIGGVKTSFIREILKVTENPEIISFAGGLPSPELFPVDEMREIAHRIMKDAGRNALQYSTTEGFLPLREWICQRYQQRSGLHVSPDEILITTGSQQGLDLLGKVLINPGDRLIIEKPGYLGAIQSFSMYEPDFIGVDGGIEGINTHELAARLAEGPAKLLYCVPNFQNPSGATYSARTRQEVAALASRHGLILVEDDPYGELRFRGEDLPPMRAHGAPSVMLGSFSKLVAPGLRVGWVCAPRALLSKLVVAKQAADLHTGVLDQRILHGYLSTVDLPKRLATLRAAYGEKQQAMFDAFRKYMPAACRCTQPEGGMFLWATLPDKVSSRVLFDKAAAAGVAFVPGTAFFVDGSGDNTLRLNFTNTPIPRIDEGMRRLGQAVNALL